MRGDDIKKAIYDWISTESGLATIWEYSNAPRPPRPFISTFFSSFAPVGKIEDFSLTEEISGKGLMTRRAQHEATLNITYHALESSQQINGVDVLSKIRLSLSQENVKKILADVGMGYLDILSLNVLPMQLGTSFQEKVTMDLSFMVALVGTEEIDLIKRVEMPGTYVKANGEEIEQTAIVEDI